MRYIFAGVREGGRRGRGGGIKCFVKGQEVLCLLWCGPVFLRSVFGGGVGRRQGYKYFVNGGKTYLAGEVLVISFVVRFW